ncbi:hypothetical protein J26TS2_27650 [Shouchella clausii]|nr:hypothetical protein J26TS2_27650 [Shouchella clausii]
MQHVPKPSKIGKRTRFADLYAAGRSYRMDVLMNEAESENLFSNHNIYRRATAGCVLV